MIGAIGRCNSQTGNVGNSLVSGDNLQVGGLAHVTHHGTYHVTHHVTHHMTDHVTCHVTHQVTHYMTHHMTHLGTCTTQSPILCYSK